VLEEMHVATGVDVEAMLEAGRRAEEVLGQRLRSNVIRSGPVIHGESAPAKEAGVRPE
jgi:hydroxymethylglutaryl-CoA lyase